MKLQVIYDEAAEWIRQVELAERRSAWPLLDDETHDLIKEGLRAAKRS